MTEKEYLERARRYFDLLGFSNWVVEAFEYIPSGFFGQAAAQTELMAKTFRISMSYLRAHPIPMVDALPHETAHALMYQNENWDSLFLKQCEPGFDYHDDAWQSLAQRLGGSGGKLTVDPLCEEWNSRFKTQEDAFNFIEERARQWTQQSKLPG